MKIDIKRFEYGTAYIISRVYIDNKYECYGMETKPVIPKGTYIVTSNFSKYFNRSLPCINNIPNFKEVYIHYKNYTDLNTKGSIILGSTWIGTDFIGNTSQTFVNFNFKLDDVLKAGYTVAVQIGDSVEDFCQEEEKFAIG